jgi:hypothetical protein
MIDAPSLASVASVCDLTWLGPSDGDGNPQAPPKLLIEIPHGSTQRADYDTLAAQLRSTLPENLEEFFYVNTDIGAPECALRIGDALASAAGGIGVLLIRSRIPRTFIDCNRVIAGIPGVVVEGLTPALPSYIHEPDDHQLLKARHRRYHEVVARAYDLVCGAGGLALQLHSYAPRSVEIATIDETIVDKLRWAYTPEVYARWARRPDIDIICESTDDAPLSSPALVNSILDNYRSLGLEVGASATYRLHPSAMGYHYARRFPGQVVCVELNRELVADPFTPLAESPLSAAKIERLARPLARSLRRALRDARRRPSSVGDITR